MGTNHTPHKKVPLSAQPTLQKLKLKTCLRPLLQHASGKDHEKVATLCRCMHNIFSGCVGPGYPRTLHSIPGFSFSLNCSGLRHRKSKRLFHEWRCALQQSVDIHESTKCSHDDNVRVSSLDVVFVEQFVDQHFRQLIEPSNHRT